MCGRWNITQTRVREGNRGGTWRFKCTCGKMNNMDSETSRWVENQIEAWTIVSDFRSIEE